MSFDFLSSLNIRSKTNQLQVPIHSQSIVLVKQSEHRLCAEVNGIRQLALVVDKNNVQ